MVQATSGFPANILIFFLGNRLELPFAGMTQRTFGGLALLLEAREYSIRERSLEFSRNIIPAFGLI